MAGKSTRFQGLRPKWMLTHPITNNYMVLESIKGLNLDFYDQIYFICLKESESSHEFSRGFRVELEKMNIWKKTSLVYLDKPTKSQAETVYEAIKKCSITGHIFIKDSDGYFELSQSRSSNQVVFRNLNGINAINPSSKSYVTLDKNKFLTNIVEKNVISPYFCVGGYGFESSQVFNEAYKKILDTGEEIYLSHVIYQLLLMGYQFEGIQVENFLDWGTLDDWNLYKNNYKCFFIDIDGVLISNTSNHFKPYRGTGFPQQSNIELINRYFHLKHGYIVLTTSRAESERQETILELSKHNISYHQLIMNLPHCKRVLINDYSASNPYPAAESINLLRDHDNLNLYLK